MKGIFSKRLTALGLTAALLAFSCLTGAGTGDLNQLVNAGEPVTVFEFDDDDAALTGSWTLETGDNPLQHGTGFRYTDWWSGNNTATYTATIEKAGWYDIFGWWIELSNRATNAPFTITCGDQEPITVQVNQQEKGSQWNRLHNVYANVGDVITVTISNQDANQYVIADGLRIALDETSDGVILDDGDAVFDGDWVVETYTYGQRFGDTFRYADCPVAEGDTPDRTATYSITAESDGLYEVFGWWTELSNRPINAPFTIRCAEQSQTVRVNQQEMGGRWNYLGYVQAAKGQEISVVIGNNAGAQYSYVIADAVMIKPAQSIRNFSITLDYDTKGGSVIGKTADIASGEEVTLTAVPNQGYECKGWYRNGERVCDTASYTLSLREDITLTPRFVEVVMENGVVLDNTDAVFVGGDQWVLETAPHSERYGDNFMFTNGWLDMASVPERTATYTYTADQAGTYKVYGWWTTHANRSQNSPFTIQCGEQSQTLRVNQQENGGMWNYLGSVEAAEGQAISVVISNNAGEGYVIADAIGFEKVSAPTQTYTITVDYNAEGGTVTGKTAGIESGESVTLTAEPRSGYAFGGWFKDGVKVCDTLSYTLTVEGNVTLTAQFGEIVTPDGVIVDDEDAVFAGDWTLESADCFDQRYGSGFRYKVWNGADNQPSATAAFTVTAEEAGYYEIYAWWTTNPNRADDAPYTISSGGGRQTVRVNQRESGGFWNLLGGVTAAKGEEISVVLGNNSDNGYVIADAVKFAKVEAPETYSVSLTYDQTAGAVAGKTAGLVAGETVTLTAAPKAGWILDGWYKGTERVCATADYTLTVRDNVSLTVKFVDAGVDKTALLAAIEDAKAAKTDGRYAGALPSVQKKLDAALTAAETVYKNDKATEAAVEKALAGLAAAVEQLSQRAADKAELTAMIAYAEGLQLGDFQTAGQDAFTKSLESAKKVINDKEAQQPAADQALYDLVHAIAALRLKVS